MRHRAAPLVLALLASALALSGCWRLPAPPAVMPETTAAQEIAAVTSDTSTPLRERLDHAAAMVAQWQATLAALRIQEQQLQREALQSKLRWMMWALIVGAVLAFVAAFFVALARKMLLLGAAGAASAAVAIYVMIEVLNVINSNLFLIGAGGVALLAAGLGYYLYKHSAALRAAVQTVDVIWDRDDPAREAMADHVRRVQGKAQPDLKRLAMRERRKAAGI